jgi:hypothetical protein
MSKHDSQTNGTFGSRTTHWLTEPHIDHDHGLPVHPISLDSSDDDPSPDSHDYSHSHYNVEQSESQNPYTVSSLFPPSLLVDGQQPNVFLCSSDMVLFYVHIPVLLSASRNHFGGWLFPELTASASSDYPLVINATESSQVWSIALCIIYGCELPVPHPSLPLIEQSIAILAVYGISPKTILTPEQPIYGLLRSHLEKHALEVYALAAQYDIYVLASEASTYLMEYPFNTIPDGMARKIGGVYMYRLGKLQIHRVEEFKRILLEPPKPHKETRSCGTLQQADLMRSYTLSVAYMAWDARPGTYILFSFACFPSLSYPSCLSSKLVSLSHDHFLGTIKQISPSHGSKTAFSALE